MLKVLSPTEARFAPPQSGGAIGFGQFCLIPSARSLAKDGAPVCLGARALDVLIALVERVGRVVSNAELFAIVWPDTFVVESNLRAQILALRKALGDGRSGARYIVSIRGRGYAFVAKTEPMPGAGRIADAARSFVASGRDHMPSPLVEFNGPGEIVSEIVERLLRECYITVRLELTKYNDERTAGPSKRLSQPRLSISLE